MLEPGTRYLLDRPTSPMQLVDGCLLEQGPCALLLGGPVSYPTPRCSISRWGVWRSEEPTKLIASGEAIVLILKESFVLCFKWYS